MSLQLAAKILETKRLNQELQEDIRKVEFSIPPSPFTGEEDQEWLEFQQKETTV